MKKFVFGRKVGMTQVIKEDGQVLPVTVLQVGPATVVSKVKEGAVVLLGFDEVEEKRLTKPKKGFFKKQKTKGFRVLKECSLDAASDLSVNDLVGLDQFSEDDVVTVSGKSIGKGFAGTIKRHKFGRGPMSHGSKNHRLPGSIGGGTTPGRVLKGTRMGGRLGGVRVTVKNLRVVKVDSESGLLFIKGGVPGKKGTLLEIFS